MKKISLFLLFTFTFSLFTFSQSLIISAGSLATNSNTEINVPVMVKNMENIGAISLVLNYNPNEITYINEVNVNPEISEIIVNSYNGKIYISWTASGYPLDAFNISDGKLFDLKFKIKDVDTKLIWDTVTPGNCEIQDVDNKTIPMSFINSDISIRSKITGVLTYANIQNSSLNNVLLTLISSDSSVIKNVLTDSAGKYMFENIKPGYYTISSSSSKTFPI